MGITSQSSQTSFKHPAPKLRQKKLWDPVTVLDIINPSRGCLTCVGYAPSCGRRCRNPINQDNRTSAFQILEELSYINVSITDIEPKLHRLARLTLCLRYHQNQRTEMVQKWSRKIDQLQTPSRSSTDTKVDSERVEDRLKDMEELLARLFNKYEGAEEFASSSPAGQRYYRKQAERPSNQEDEAKKRREEDARKSREREREHEQQTREQRAREVKEQKKREEQRHKEEQEAKAKRAREQEELNERIRQRTEQARKDRERKAKEQAEKEREEWDKLWLRYVLRWDALNKQDIKASSSQLQELIPWPVKSGDWRDVAGPAIEEFFRQAPPEDTTNERMLAFMKMECLKWHADRIPTKIGAIEDKVLGGMFNTGAQVAIKVRAETGRKRER